MPKKWNIEKVKQLFEKENLTILDEKYKNNTTKLNVYTFFGADVALQCNSNNNWVELLTNDTTIIKDKISKKLIQKSDKIS